MATTFPLACRYFSIVVKYYSFLRDHIVYCNLITSYLSTMRPSFLAFALACITVASGTNTSAQTSVPTYAPIPSAAVGPPVSNTTGFRVESFGQGAYMVTDGIYQSIFFVACESIVVVDAPPTIGHKIMKAFRTVTDLPVSHVVYSHNHADHIGAAYLLDGPDVTFIAHEETLRELAQVNDTNRPTPDLTFSKEHTLHVCNQTLRLSYKGPNCWNDLIGSSNLG